MDAVGEQRQQAGGEFNRSSRDDGTIQPRSPSTRRVACVIPATNDDVRLGAGQGVEHPPEGDLAQWPFAVQVALQRVAVDTCSSSEIGSFALRKANKVAHLRPLARRPVESLDNATQLMVQGPELIEGDVRVVGSDPGGLLEAGQVEPPTVTSQILEIFEPTPCLDQGTLVPWGKPRVPAGWQVWGQTRGTRRLAGRGRIIA